ncbi:SRPBCC family protein [Streptomyces globosus]|uniref:SRPBCC family protein n=1 Tax=Streptomyces globosus TaxID=68209 RepID=UPI0031DC41C7
MGPHRTARAERSPAPCRRPPVHRFRFRTAWDLDAPPDRVYAVLARAEDYPRWWPQVRRAERTGGHTGTAYIRSALPYTLRVTTAELLSDPRGGILEAALGGDMEGWARWTVRPRRGPRGTTGTRALYEQEVEVRRPLLRRLSGPARPLLHLNHALMMRAGRRGLARLLAGPPEAV